MIITRLIGGLGNQLFQYALGRALAHRHGTALKLDLSAYDEPVGHGVPRRYSLDDFRLEAARATPAEIDRLKYGGRARALLGLRAATYVREARANFFDGAAAQAGPDAYLKGYWQTERYFAEIRELLLRELTPKNLPEPALAQRMAQTPSVGLHVRRGDYVTDPRAAARFGTCSPAYYARAAGLPEFAGATFFVFSDDIEWARANLHLPGPAEFVSRPGLADTAELWLLSRCRHQVIANSSFSWWAAWLNPAPDKVVVAPARWLAKADDESPDVVPAAWRRLQE